jgi:hypothetical protein
MYIKIISWVQHSYFLFYVWKSCICSFFELSWINLTLLLYINLRVMIHLSSFMLCCGIFLLQEREWITKWKKTANVCLDSWTKHFCSIVIKQLSAHMLVVLKQCKCMCSVNSIQYQFTFCFAQVWMIFNSSHV